MTAARFQVTFDAAEPARLAEFWAEALGYVCQPLPPGFESVDVHVIGPATSSAVEVKKAFDAAAGPRHPARVPLCRSCAAP